VPRDLPIGNGTLLINFDRAYQLRDIYYPRVGQENHTSGDACRFGVWAGDAFVWLDDAAWTRELRYAQDTLVTEVRLEHPQLKVGVTFNDAVDLGRDLFIRRVRVDNLGPEREVRLFFHYPWTIYGIGVGDTAMYYPAIRALVAYKGQRYFAVSQKVGDRTGLDRFACGKKDVGGAQGTWRDAEDGELGNNAIEQGSVDMTAAAHLGTLPAGGTAVMYHWLLAAQDFTALQALAEMVVQRGPEFFLERTRSYWPAWVNKEERDFANLSPQVANLYRRSLLIVRTQVDNGGAIVAANDSDGVKDARDHYSYMWPRDGALVAYAMDQARYMEVSRRFIDLCARIVTPEGFFLHKYTPAGEPGSSWHPWIDSAGNPQYPIQEDETGAVLFALWHHYDVHRDFEFVKAYYRGLIVRSAEFLARYRDPHTGLPDASYDLWEERRGIMSFTVAAVWAGLQAAANFAALYGETALESRYREVAAAMKQATEQYLFDPERNRFLRRIVLTEDGSVEKDLTIDSSLYGLFYFGMFAADDPKITSTMEAVYQRLWCQTPVGGIARYEDDYYWKLSQDIEKVPGNPWFICTMWYAQWLVARAKTLTELEAAARILDWVAAAALPSGVLPEQLDPYSGAPISVSPLTWSHATVISLVQEYIHKRAQLLAAPARPRRARRAAAAS
jgi:oligosaccharide amylase